MPGLRVCIDVDDLDRGIAFYTRALGLATGRRWGAEWVELHGAPCVIDLIVRPPGTPALIAEPRVLRTYDRHWTPVHLDFVVEGLEEAVDRAVAAGAKVEHAIETKPWGRMALVADPFGHGFCLLEFRGRGYDEVVAPG